MSDGRHNAIVVSIVDDSRLVLNLGREDGLKGSEVFLVFGHGPDIIDPSNNRSLGRLEIVRGRGIVSHLQDRMCTIKSITADDTPEGKRIIKRTNPLLYLGREEEVVEFGPTYVPFDGPKIGDLARQIG